MIQLKVIKRIALAGLPWFIILHYVVVGAIRLRYPGTQYDEALYLNAALGGVDQTTFMTKTFHGVPVLLMPYIGALKAYLFFPIFALFGVSAITMRFPLLIITGFSLFIFYHLLQEQIGKRLGLLILLLTSLDASFIIFTRLDNGPVVLEFMCKVIGLLLLLKFAKTNRALTLAAFWIFMLMGVFNKINFIWYVNAFSAAFAVTYGIRLWRKFSPRQRLQTILISGAGYSLCVAYYLYINSSYHLGGKFGFVGWITLHNNLVTLVDGSWFYNYALSAAHIGTDRIFWVMFSTIVIGSLLLAYTVIRRQRLYDSSFIHLFGFFALGLALLVGQIAMTRNATAGWHYFAIYPLFGSLFVLSLAVIGKLFIPGQQVLARALLLIIVGGFCLYQLTIYHQYIAAFNKPTFNATWSTAIYSLIDFTASKHQSQFISLDWGTQTQLTGYDSVPNKYSEAMGPIMVSDPVHNEDEFQRYIATRPGAYYITHAVTKRVIPANTDQFFELARQHGYEPQLVKTIADSNEPVFEVYQLAKQ